MLTSGVGVPLTMDVCRLGEDGDGVLNFEHRSAKAGGAPGTVCLVYHVL
jgi:hypothetical protein